MIKGKKRELISLDAILSKITEYDIYRYYLDKDFIIGSSDLINSPFRKEDKGSFGIFLSRESGRMCHNDYGDSTKSGTCVDFVKQVCGGLDYYNALCQIDKDFNLGICNKYDSNKPNYSVITSQYIQPKEVLNKEKLIQIIPKTFTSEDLDYWKQFGITLEELKKNKIYSVGKLYINKRLINNYSKELRFAYVFDKYIKIYSPYSIDYKWISSVPIDYISNLDEIKYKLFTGSNADKLIIGKSLKDQIVLQKFFPDVCSSQNESHVSINEEDIRLFQKYPRVLINYDADEPGVRNCIYYNQFGFGYFNTPSNLVSKSIKDVSDFVKHKGLDKLEEFLKYKQLI